MKTFRLLLLSSLPLFVFSACPAKPTVCDAITCGAGCCDASGKCQLGASSDGCGTGGQLCAQCFPGQLCSQGLCMTSATGGGGGSTGGGTGGSGGGTTTPLVCSAGKTACSGSCVDTRSDPRNCGNCGTLCNSNQFCANSACTVLPAACAGGCPSGFFCTAGNECKPGCASNADCPQPGSCDTRLNTCSCLPGFHGCGQSCEADNNTSACGPSCASCEGIPNAVPACTNSRCDFTCNPGLHRCGNECKSNNDIATCGTSCTPCEPPPNSVAICGNQMCDFVCNSGFHRCGNSCVQNTSVNSCGTNSCTPCTAPPNGTATCNGFACDFTCNAGFHRCGSSCVPNSSTNSCGSACSPCAPPANSVATCDGVSCGFSCNTGAHGCNGACVSNLSVSSCGATSCTPCSPPPNAAATCNGVSCDFICNFGTHRCGATCSDNTNVNSCGNSCNPCPNGPANSARTCDGTTCGWQCSPGFHDCGGVCVSNSSVTQCGLSCTSCPAVANASPVCASGACDFVCNAGFHRCGNQCLPNNDVESCGTSCTACPNGPANSTRTCNGTSCGFSCGGGFNACNGECVPPDFASACGAACQVCTAAGTFDRPVCSTGTCGTACITSCNAACVDVNRDPANCGTCGTTCVGGQTCTAGECRSSCTTGPAYVGVLPYVPVSANPNYKFRAEDLNGDGRVDLIDNGSTVGLHVRYSNADGTFLPPVLISLSSVRATGFAVADLNGDGRKDIVATRAATSSQVVVVLNSASGFGTPSYHSMLSNSPSATGVVLLADFNGDTRIDIMVPSTSTYTSYFLQSATPGVFPSGYSNYSSNTLINTISGEVGDFNEDGRIDVVLTTASQYQVALNNPSASFPASSNTTVWLPQTSSLTGLGTLGAVRVADLNNDMNLDLLLRNSAGAAIALGTGTGSFTAGTTVAHSAIMTSPLVPVDLNGDGLLDLIGGGTSVAYIWLATAAATWPATPANKLINAPSAEQVAVAAGQLIGSAVPELFTAPASSTSVNVSILVNEGAGLFPGATGSASVGGTTAAVMGDVDGDTDRDLVLSPPIATGGTGTGSVLLGSNNGGFGSPVSTLTLRGDELALGRLNGDSFADLVATIESTTTPGVDVFLGGAGGVFGAPTRLATTSLPTRVVIARVDTDAIADIVVGTSTAVEWFRGNGDGSFASAQIAISGQGATQALALVDMNLDGKMDLLLNSGTGSLRVFLGYGTGAFALTAFSTVTSSQTATDVVGTDFDRDGRPDVAVGTSTGVLLFRGTGTGALTTQAAQPSMVGRLVVSDLDNDGFLDLVSMNGELQVARGQANFTFLPRQLFAPGRTLAPAVVIADQINGDTFRDVLVHTTGGELWTFLGVCR